jgi:hypothetical protein
MENKVYAILIMLFNSAKHVIFDVDGTLLVRNNDNTHSLTLLGEVIVQLGITVDILSFGGWDSDALAQYGIRVGVILNPTEYMDVDMHTGETSKVLPEGYVLVDDMHHTLVREQIYVGV